MSKMHDLAGIIEDPVGTKLKISPAECASETTQNKKEKSVDEVAEIAEAIKALVVDGPSTDVKPSTSEDLEEKIAEAINTEIAKQPTIGEPEKEVEEDVEAAPSAVQAKPTFEHETEVAKLKEEHPDSKIASTFEEVKSEPQGTATKILSDMEKEVTEGNSAVEELVEGRIEEGKTDVAEAEPKYEKAEIVLEETKEDSKGNQCFESKAPPVEFVERVRRPYGGAQ